MAYVHSLNEQGYEPTENELEVYARDPFRVAVVGPGLLAAMGELLKTPIVEYVQNVGWIRFRNSDPRRAIVTDCGKAALAAMTKLSAAPPPDNSVLVLRSQDPFVYANVVGALGEIESYMLVDPYFRLQFLQDLLDHTKCSRILLGPAQTTPEQSRLAVAVRDLPDSPIKIRVASSQFHDRFVIPGEGEVYSLGTSLTGVGKHFSLIVKIGSPWCGHVREYHEGLWKSADVLGTEQSLAEGTETP